MNALASALLLACPICFGDSKSPMVHGAKVGVAFLLVVIVGVLVAIALTARSWARRARALEAAERAELARAGLPVPAPAPPTPGFFANLAG